VLVALVDQQLPGSSRIRSPSGAPEASSRPSSPVPRREAGSASSTARRGPAPSQELRRERLEHGGSRDGSFERRERRLRPEPSRHGVGEQLEHGPARGEVLRSPGCAWPVLREGHEPTGAGAPRRSHPDPPRAAPAHAGHTRWRRGSRAVLDRGAPGAAVEDRELVREVEGARPHQLGHERRLAAAAAAREHDRPAVPAHDAGMDERPSHRAAATLRRISDSSTATAWSRSACARADGCRVDAAPSPRGVTIRDPDGEDLVDDRRRQGPPAGRQVGPSRSRRQGCSCAPRRAGRKRRSTCLHASSGGRSVRSAPSPAAAAHQARQAPHRGTLPPQSSRLRRDGIHARLVPTHGREGVQSVRSLRTLHESLRPGGIASTFFERYTRIARHALHVACDRPRSGLSSTVQRADRQEGHGGGGGGERGVSTVLSAGRAAGPGRVPCCACTRRGRMSVARHELAGRARPRYGLGARGVGQPDHRGFALAVRIRMTGTPGVVTVHREGDGARVSIMDAELGTRFAAGGASRGHR